MFLLVALIPAICSRAYGGDRQLIQLPAYYYPLDLLGEKKAPDQRGGFKKMRKRVSKRSAAYLTDKMGKNYFTQKIAPIVLNSWSQVFVPKKLGEIGLKSPLWAVDKTVSGMVAQEKKTSEPVGGAGFSRFSVSRQYGVRSSGKPEIELRKWAAKAPNALQETHRPQLSMGKFFLLRRYGDRFCGQGF